MANNIIKEQLEIEFISHAPAGRQWWVCAYAVRADGTPVSAGIPTSRILGQFESLESAQQVYPQARISYKTKKLLDEAR